MNDKIVFTLCSNNYLSQAKALGDSVLKYSPEYSFVIGLVDKYSKSIDYTAYSQFNIVPIDKMRITNLNQILNKYDIVELNTCIKPFCFQYLFEEFKNVQYIYYIDPDILLYSSLSIIETEFNDKQILLTPHITSCGKEDMNFLIEKHVLKYGVFNLGFLGLRRSDVVHTFLEWFSSRLFVYCYNDIDNGLFVDQLWANFIPAFFSNSVSVSLNPGLNMAYWNLHERSLSFNKNTETYLVNDCFPLVFFHFSNFDVSTKRLKTRSRRDEAILNKLCEEYGNFLVSNNYFDYKNTKCVYVRNIDSVKMGIIKKIGRIFFKIGKKILLTQKDINIGKSAFDY